jgi:hypothetical protein
VRAVVTTFRHLQLARIAGRSNGHMIRLLGSLRRCSVSPHDEEGANLALDCAELQYQRGDDLTGLTE